MKKITLIILLGFSTAVFSQGPWEFSNTLDGWTSGASYGLNSDHITFTLNSGNTTVLEHATLNVNGDNNAIVAVTLKNTSDGSGPTELRATFKKDDGSGNINRKELALDNNDNSLRTYYIDLSNSNWNNDSHDGASTVTDRGEQFFQIHLRSSTGSGETVEIHKIEFLAFEPKPELVSYTFETDTDEEGWVFNGVQDNYTVASDVLNIELPATTVNDEIVEFDQTEYQIDADSYDYVNIIYRNESENDEFRFQFRSIENNYGNLYGVNMTLTENMISPSFGLMQIDLKNISSNSWKGTTFDFRILIRNEEEQANNPAFSNDITTPGNFIIESITFSNVSLLGNEEETIGNAIISLYPNPANNLLNIKSSTPIDSIEIHNILGQRITSIQGSNQIDVSNLTNGTYTCKIYLEDGSVIIKRFVKQ